MRLFGASLGDGRVALDATYSASASDLFPAAASASFSLESDGDISKTGDGAGDIGDWVSPKGAAPGGYECRATLNSGSTPSGTLGSWVALSSTQTWGLTQAIVGSKTCELLIEIRRGSTTLDSTVVTITVDVT